MVSWGSQRDNEDEASPSNRCVANDALVDARCCSESIPATPTSIVSSPSATSAGNSAHTISSIVKPTMVPGKSLPTIIIPNATMPSSVTLRETTRPRSRTHATVASTSKAREILPGCAGKILGTVILQSVDESNPEYVGDYSLLFRGAASLFQKEINLLVNPAQRNGSSTKPTIICVDAVPKFLHVKLYTYNKIPLQQCQHAVSTISTVFLDKRYILTANKSRVAFKFGAFQPQACNFVPIISTSSTHSRTQTHDGRDQITRRKNTTAIVLNVTTGNTRTAANDNRGPHNRSSFGENRTVVETELEASPKDKCVTKYLFFFGWGGVTKGGGGGGGGVM